MIKIQAFSAGLDILRWFEDKRIRDLSGYGWLFSRRCLGLSKEKEVSVKSELAKCKGFQRMGSLYLKGYGASWRIIGF
jgi:hypothetical protein